MEQLKKCPFCGGEAVLHVEDGIRVICRECCATSKCLVDGYSNGKPNGSAWKAVVKAWNTRKPLERIVERMENDGGCDAQDEWSKGWDEAVTRAIEIVKEEM